MLSFLFTGEDIKALIYLIVEFTGEDIKALIYLIVEIVMVMIKIKFF